LLGGDITCTSKEGVGSTFTIMIPVNFTGVLIQEDPESPLSEPDSGNPASSPAAEPAAKEGEGARSVLIVDDNNIAAMQIQAVLERAGMTIRLARNGAEALVLVETSCPDAIILDLMMPGVNGFEFLERLRSKSEWGAIPVLVLTAQELTSADRSMLARLKAAEVFQKGAVDRDLLLKGVMRLLNRHKAIAPIPLLGPRERGRLPARVLVVEDNQDNLFTLREILGDVNVDLMIAQDGSEALKIAREHRPDLILMDVQLPGMSGIDAVSELKADAHLAMIPVVAMTARAMKGDREELLQKGFDDYLGKPLEPATVVEVVRKWLGQEKGKV